MFLARLEGSSLRKAYLFVRCRREATDNAVQKLYLEDYTMMLERLGYSAIGTSKPTEAISMEQQVTDLIRDNTKRKDVEQSLIESERRFRNLFNSITDLIYTQDMEGRFTSVNPAMHKLFGYDLDEFLGHRITDFMKPDRQFGLTA